VRSRTLAVGILTAIVLGLVWARLGPTPASAQTPDPGLQFYIAVAGVPNCDTKSGDATCNLAPGSTFVIDVYLEPLPSDIPSYDGFDIYLGYTDVTAEQVASTDAWPDCAFPAQNYGEAGTVRLGCIIGVPPAGPSTYTGLIGTSIFTCAQSGSVALIHGDGKTDLVEDVGKIHIESAPQETLTINCVAGGVTPIPTTPQARATSAPPSTPLPPTAQAQATATALAQATATAKAKATAAAKATPGTTQVAGGGGGGGLSAGVIAFIVIAAVVVAGGAGFFGWRYLQSRRGAGGGT
jgi:hypothetical protein